MHHPRWFATLLLPVLTLLALPPALLAQEAANDSMVIDSVQVQVVNVDVSVTDRKGDPVPDLRLDDFQVFEDGKAVPLTNFAFVERPREAASPSTVPPARTGTPPTGTGAPSASAAVDAGGDDEPAHLILYFDEVNIRPRNRNQLLEQMQAFVDRGMSPGDRVMVVTSGAGQVVELPFTDDRRALRAALERVGRRATQRTLDDSEQQRILTQLDRADEDTMGDALRDLESLELSQRERALATLNTLQYFITALSGLPGRKALLYMSDGIAGLADQDLGRLGKISAAANANRVTFYGFDTRGWTPDPSINPAARGGDMLSLVNDTLNTNLHYPLKELSAATGGFALTNSNNFDGALAKVSTDLGSYYSLGYTPRSPNDGRYHRIEVKVKGRGVNVRHREGYLARKTLDQLADRTLAALTFDTGDNPLGVALRPTPVETAADGSRQLPIMVQLPVQSLGLVPRGETYQGEVNLLVLIQASDGRMAPAQEIRLPLSIPKEQVEGEKPANVAYRLALPVIETGFKIAVGARDAVSSLESFATLQIGG